MTAIESSTSAIFEQPVLADQSPQIPDIVVNTEDRIDTGPHDRVPIEKAHLRADGGTMTDTKRRVTYSLTKESPYELWLYLVQAVATVTGLSVAAYFLL